MLARSLGRNGTLLAIDGPGTVSVREKVVTFNRPGLIEEYSVAVDGVRQDFVVSASPVGSGPLRVELAVAGATAEASTDGARLILTGSQRILAYNRLQVVDATGRTLTSRMEVPASDRLTLVVEDNGATYPLRIDPTFSDFNWSTGFANHGPNGGVSALAVSGTDLYVGGVRRPPQKPGAKRQSITFGSLTDKRFGDAPFALTATASSGLPIVFSIVSFFFRKSFVGRSSDERIRQSMISLPTACSA